MAFLRRGKTESLDESSRPLTRRNSLATPSIEVRDANNVRLSVSTTLLSPRGTKSPISPRSPVTPNGTRQDRGGRFSLEAAAASKLSSPSSSSPSSSVISSLSRKLAAIRADETPSSPLPSGRRSTLSTPSGPPNAIPNTPSAAVSLSLVPFDSSSVASPQTSMLTAGHRRSASDQSTTSNISTVSQQSTQSAGSGSGRADNTVTIDGNVSETALPRWTRSSSSIGSNASATDSNIKVIARVRPPNESEAAGHQMAFAFPDDGNSIVTKDNVQPMTFTYDKVFGPSVSQEAMYDVVGKEAINDVLAGYNSTIFCYGQTGSGKTYTMYGASLLDLDHRGIVPRASRQIFEAIENCTEPIDFILRCSMMEIHKEHIRDLFNDASGHLKIKENPVKGVYVDGLVEEFISCEEDMLAMLELGNSMRAVAQTKMNSTSSRSHTIFMLTVQQKLPSGEEKIGKLNLVDLAGSEKLRKTGAEGETLEEAKKINKSLSALGNVIHALTDRAKHVPYRDSKLTRILQESLGGNYKTTLIVTCSPDISNVDESISSLKFAQRAKSIKNVVKVNVTRSPAQLLVIIEQLKKELEASLAENVVLRERLLQAGESVDSTILSQPDLVQHASSVIMRADTSTDTEDLDLNQRTDLESMVKSHEIERTRFTNESTLLREENRILRSQVESMSRIISQFDEKFQNTFDKLLNSYCSVDPTSEATPSNQIKSVDSDRHEIEKALPISWSVSRDSTDSIDPLEVLQRQIVKTNIVNQKLKHDKLVAEWKLSLLDSKENQIAIVMKEFSSKMKELEAQFQTQDQSPVEMIPTTHSVSQATSSSVGVGSTEHKGTDRQMTFAGDKVDNSIVACDGAVSKERSTSGEWVSPRALQRRAFVSVTHINEDMSNLGSGTNILVPSSTQTACPDSASGSTIDNGMTVGNSIESTIDSTATNISIPPKPCLSDHPHRLAVLEPLPLEEPVVAVDNRFAGVALADENTEAGGPGLAHLVSMENMKRRERDMRISFSPKGSSSAVPVAACESTSEALTNNFIPPSPPLIHKLVRRRPLLYSPPAASSQTDSESVSTISDTSATTVAPSLRLLAASAANQSLPDLLNVTPVKQRSSRILLPVSKRAAFSLERQSSSVSRVFESGTVSSLSTQSGCSSPLNSLSDETRALRESLENRMRAELAQLQNEINSLQIQLRCSERVRSECESELNRLHKKYADLKATSKSQKQTLEKQNEKIERLQCERDLISESAEQFHMLFEDEISKADLVMREQALQWGQLMEAVELNFWHDLDVKQTHIDSLQKQLVDLTQPKRK